jgi:hypothetical protein
MQGIKNKIVVITGASISPMLMWARLLSVPLRKVNSPRFDAFGLDGGWGRV